MKKFNKVMALVLSVAVVLAMSVPMMVFAADQSSITINNAVSDHAYTAYQILKGDVSGGKLSNVSWGDDITDAGKEALYTKYGLTGDNKTAAKVAEAIANAAKAQTGGAATVADTAAIEFANTVGTNVSGGKKGSLSGTTYKISDLADGYYMIVDTWAGNNEAVNGEDYTLSRYMVQLVGTATVNNKADKPTVDKKIVENNKDVENNTANIGDTVNYKVTSKVPEYAGYKEYYMDFNDTLSKGLDFVQTGGTVSGITVKIGDNVLDADNYTVTVGQYSATEGTAIKIHFKDMVSRKTTFPVGSDIEISYSAMVNDNAVIGNTGNPNTMKLDYSNKPDDSGDGIPDNDNDGVKGQTPDSVTNTFVTEIELKKVIKGTETPLAGAVFNVKGTQINKVLITGDHFVEENDGTYYLLTDNTYTDKAPTEATKANYANLTDGNLPVTKKYKKEAYSNTSVQETKDVDFQVVSGSDGIIKVTGLKEGTYTFTEIQAPDGYNKLSDPITVVVESNIATIKKADEFKWTVGADSTAQITKEEDTNNAANGVYAFKVENGEGTELPETGGIGTTIFYVLGAILVIGAGVLLVTRRRMNAN